MTHVYLGRFAPLHEGHRILLTKLVANFGVDNCLVVIGSANVLSERTPFTFESRKKMIQKYNAELNIIPLDDVADDDVWLDNLEKLENSMGSKFIFYGGCQKDLEILSQRFETHVLVDRFTEGKGISATEIRKTLKFTDFKPK